MLLHWLLIILVVLAIICLTVWAVNRSRR